MKSLFAKRDMRQFTKNEITMNSCCEKYYANIRNLIFAKIYCIPFWYTHENLVFHWKALAIKYKKLIFSKLDCWICRVLQTNSSSVLIFFSVSCSIWHNTDRTVVRIWELSKACWLLSKACWLLSKACWLLSKALLWWLLFIVVTFEWFVIPVLWSLPKKV